MERAIYMILGMVMLAIASGAAQEIEIPEDAPRETWQMIYDDYRSLLCCIPNFASIFNLI